MWFFKIKKESPVLSASKVPLGHNFHSVYWYSNQLQLLNSMASHVPDIFIILYQFININICSIIEVCSSKKTHAVNGVCTSSHISFNSYGRQHGLRGYCIMYSCSIDNKKKTIFSQMLIGFRKTIYTIGLKFNSNMKKQTHATLNVWGRKTNQPAMVSY